MSSISPETVIVLATTIITAIQTLILHLTRPKFPCGKGPCYVRLGVDAPRFASIPEIVRDASTETGAQ